MRKCIRIRLWLASCLMCALCLAGCGDSDAIDGTADNGTVPTSDVQSDGTVSPDSTEPGESCWKDVDTFGKLPYNIIVTAADTLVVGGYGDIDGETHWIIRRSTDKGSTWETVSALLGMGGELWFDGKNTIYSHGADYNENKVNKLANFSILKSTDDGVTWQKLYSDNEVTGGMLAVDSAGTIYRVIDKKDVWTIYRSVDGSTNWEKVDEWESETDADAVAVDSKNKIYIVGNYSISSRAGVFQLRTSIDGKNWQTSEVKAISELGQIVDLAIDDADVIYTAGSFCSATYCSWSITKSTDGGTTFSGVDDLTDGNGLKPYIRGITIRGDSIYAFGDTDAYWHVRVSHNRGMSWETLPASSFPTDLWNLVIRDLGVTSTGEIFIVGNATPEESQKDIYPKSWRVQKFVCP